MDSQKKKKEKLVITTTSSSSLSSSSTSSSSHSSSSNTTCTNQSCFFCIMKEKDPSLRKSQISDCFKEMPHSHNQEHVLVLSGLWNIAMTQPDDPEFPSLGIFECMASLITKGIKDREWLLSHQNIYIPYYAAHVIGSYTMNKPEFAAKAVESGVLPPLIELMKGKMSWVEQRVAVRAIGHLASYKTSFESVAAYEEEVVKLAMQICTTCLDAVYVNFVAVKDKKRLNYHSDLLTRGIGGIEMENRKAEEWASQLQCWSIYILNCFASEERSLNLICNQDFLNDLCKIWGGLVNHSSPAGIGLIRILCYTKYGRICISKSEKVIHTLSTLSRSSDDWQYIGIDCLVLLLNDPDTRYDVIEIAIFSLIDLVELRVLGKRGNVGEKITSTLFLDYKIIKSKFKNKKKVLEALEEIRGLRRERRRREKAMSDEKVEDLRVLVSLIKQEANNMFWEGEIEEAIVKYSEGLDLCPIKLRRERMVLYSNRAQCYLILGDADSAIRDSTRALCLSNPANSHRKSLWRRSQAYDMKGLAKESLMDCIMFVNGFIRTEQSPSVKVPYYAARMISKQMEATWIFAKAKSKTAAAAACDVKEAGKSDGGDASVVDDGMRQYDEMMKVIMENKGLMAGLSTILEEPSRTKCASRSRREKARWRKKRGSSNASQID